MEETVRNFRQTSRLETDLLHLIADAVRICKHTNWWHPDSGGPDYIYHSLVGQRQWWYKRWNHKLQTLEQEIANAIDCRDKAMAIGGVMAYASLQRAEQVGATKQAEFLLRLAEERRHDLAIRLCRVHLSQKSTLSGDNNFLCQAAWLLAGGFSPVAEQMEFVSIGECNETLERARKAWKKLHPIPTWALDGQHSSGSDTRFMGMLPEMYACMIDSRKTILIRQLNLKLL